MPAAPPVHPAERPPAAPRELETDPPGRRTFQAGEDEWVCWVSGKSASGTGPYGLGMVVAVHFAPANSSERPRFEALLERGRFVGLFDEELRRLLARAIPIVEPERGDGTDGR